MKRLGILACVAVLVLAGAFLCVDEGFGQQGPTIVPEFSLIGDTVITNVKGEHLVIQYSDDSIWINPAIGFYFGGTLTDTLYLATIDSIINAEGRFSVTAGMWSVVDADTVAFVHPDSGDTVWYMQSTLQSGVAYLKPYANDGGTPYGVIHCDSIFGKNDTTTIFILKVSDNWFLPISSGTSGEYLQSAGAGAMATWGSRRAGDSVRAGDGLDWADTAYNVDTDKFAVRDGSVGNEDSLNPCHAMYSFSANYGNLEGYYGYQWRGQDSATYSLFLNDTNTTIYLSGDSTPTLQIQGPIESYQFILLNADSVGNDAAIKVRDSSGTEWAIGFNETTEQWTFDGGVAIDSALDVTYWGVFDSLYAEHVVGNTQIYGATLIECAGAVKADSIYTRFVVCTTGVNIAAGGIPDSCLALAYTDTALSHIHDTAEVLRAVMPDSAAPYAAAAAGDTAAILRAEMIDSAAVVANDTADVVRAEMTDSINAAGRSYLTIADDNDTTTFAMAGGNADLKITAGNVKIAGNITEATRISSGDVVATDSVIASGGVCYMGNNKVVAGGSVQAPAVEAYTAFSSSAGPDPSTGAYGQFAVDSDWLGGAFEIHDTLMDSSHAIVAVKVEHGCPIQPDLITDTIRVLRVDPGQAPGGIRIIGLECQLSEDAEYHLEFFEGTEADPTVLSIIDSLDVGASDTRDSISCSHVLDVGHGLHILTDSDDIDWMAYTIRYVIREHD